MIEKQKRITGNGFEIVPQELAPVYAHIRKKVARKLDRLRYLAEQKHPTKEEQAEVPRVLREIAWRTSEEVKDAVGAYNFGLRQSRYTIVNFQKSFGHVPPQIAKTNAEIEQGEIVASCVSSAIVHTMILPELQSKMGVICMPEHVTAAVKIHGKTYVLDPNALYQNKRTPTLSEYVTQLVEAHGNSNLLLHTLARCIVPRDNATRSNFTGQMRYFGGKNSSIASALNNWGSALALSGRHNEALGYFERAIRLNPEQPSAYTNWGSALNSLGRHEEALEKLKIGMSKIEHFSARYNLGLTLFNMNRINEALPHIRRAIELNPNETNTRGLLIDALRRVGKRSEAMEEERELHRRPGNH